MCVQIRADLYCVTHRRYRENRNGFHLVGYDAGEKLLRFRSISLAGTSDWTDYIYFYPHAAVQPPGD